MDKAKLTTKQAKFIEDALQKNLPEEVVKWLCDLNIEQREYFAGGLDVDTLIRALYIGYEVELTVEERLLQEYEAHITRDDSKERGIAIGIRKAAEIMGIKVPGMYR